METHQLCLPSEFAPLRAVREMLLPHSPPRPVSGLTRVAERAVKPKAQGQWTLRSRHKGSAVLRGGAPVCTRVLSVRGLQRWAIEGRRSRSCTADQKLERCAVNTCRVHEVARA